MSAALLICSDLDRTLLPNGAAPESPEARPRLRALAARPEVMLAYVSGRHEALLRAAIAEYGLPVPDYAIGDVGTTIYAVEGDRWRPWSEWSEHIAPDWGGATHGDLAGLFRDLAPLRLQEPGKQNRFKLSYYTAPQRDDDLLAEMADRLEAQGVRASLIWSLDEPAGVGLLDVLPASATKLHAVEFLMARRGFSPENTVFAGDSGNDLPVVASGRLRSILVRNADPLVVAEAEAALARRGCADRLYVARGGFRGMNGNYSAGVLEGVAHHYPQCLGWMGFPPEDRK